MLFERRAYTLRPGNIEAFWQLQRKWNTPEQIPGLLARNVGYFQTVAGPADQVVHLYRFDSFDDWKTRLFGVYTPERSEYFIEARKLMTAQQNMFLAPAPISALNPIWGDERDWLPGHPHFTDVSDATNLLVVESTIDFVPGGPPAYWAAYQTPGVLDDPLTTARLVACLYTLVGQQHRVILYRWFRGIVEAQEHQLARLTALAAFRCSLSGPRCSELGSLSATVSGKVAAIAFHCCRTLQLSE